jgi:integrase
MPLRLYKRKTRDGGYIWHYRGTVAGDRLRGTTETANRKIAERTVSEIENRHHKGRLFDPEEVLTFPQAVALYLKAGKPEKYLGKIEDYWKDAKVKTMTAGAITQSAIDIYPDAADATRNRQVITPTQAVINHCADLEKCAPVRVKRSKEDRTIKTPVTVEWLDTFCVHARPLTAALATFMFATACRIAEARRLTWKDIDFNSRTVLIRDSKTRKERLAHMPSRLIVALANLTSRDEPPFAGRGKSEANLRRFWDEDVALAADGVEGFERLTFHSCRHGFATKMLRDGKDAKTAAALGGWDDITLFMETYVHAIRDATLTDDIFDTPETQRAVKRRGRGEA